VFFIQKLRGSGTCGGEDHPFIIAQFGAEHQPALLRLGVAASSTLNGQALAPGFTTRSITLRPDTGWRASSRRCRRRLRPRRRFRLENRPPASPAPSPPASIMPYHMPFMSFLAIGCLGQPFRHILLAGWRPRTKRT
jgi:hypothetical protein